MEAGFIQKIKELIEGDRSVKLVAEDPRLTAELLLLFRVILADGQVKTAELEAFKRIARDSFGLNPERLEGVYQYMHDYGYETTPAQAAALFADLPQERKQALLDHMIEIAQADAELNEREIRILDKTADLLGFDLRLQKK